MDTHTVVKHTIEQLHAAALQLEERAKGMRDFANQLASDHSVPANDVVAQPIQAVNQ